MEGAFKTRRNGFQCPMSSDQIKTVVVYPISVTGYFLLTYIMLVGENNRNIQVIVMALNAALTFLLMISWISVESIDPESKPGKTGLPVICFPPPEKSARYCGTCKKTVLGLDHHCSWLNTCIGRRNYVPFICLVFLGLAQMILQTAIGVASLTIWLHSNDTKSRISELFGGKLWVFYLLASLYTALVGSLATGLAVLGSFHSYLLVIVRKGTYDWLLYRRNGNTAPKESSTIRRKRDDSERRKQQQREEWNRVISRPKSEIYAVSGKQEMGGLFSQKSASATATTNPNLIHTGSKLNSVDEVVLAAAATATTTTTAQRPNDENVDENIDENINNASSREAKLAVNVTVTAITGEIPHPADIMITDTAVVAADGDHGKFTVMAESSTHDVDAPVRIKSESLFPAPVVGRSIVGGSIVGSIVGSRKHSNSSISQRSAGTDSVADLYEAAEVSCTSGRRRDSESTSASARVRSASAHFILGLASIGTRARVYESSAVHVGGSQQANIVNNNSDIRTGIESQLLRDSSGTVIADDASMLKLQQAHSDDSLESLPRRTDEGADGDRRRVRVDEGADDDRRRVRIDEGADGRRHTTEGSTAVNIEITETRGDNREEDDHVREVGRGVEEGVQEKVTGGSREGKRERWG